MPEISNEQLDLLIGQLTNATKELVTLKLQNGHEISNEQLDLLIGQLTNATKELVTLKLQNGHGVLYVNEWQHRPDPYLIEIKQGDSIPKFKAGFTYRFHGDHKTNTLAVTQDNVTFLGAPGASLTLTSTSEFGSIFNISSSTVKISGFRFATAASQRAVKITSTASQVEISDNTSSEGLLGQLVQIEGGSGISILRNKLADTARYAVYSRRVTDLVIEGNLFGQSIGGVWNGKTVNGEHNIRLYKYTNAIIQNNVLAEREKSCLNIRQGVNCVIDGNIIVGNVTIGPLNGPEGLSVLNDPDMFVYDTRFINNALTGRIHLEMGSFNTIIEGNKINSGKRPAIYGEYDIRFLPVRQPARGTVRNNIITGIVGNNGIAVLSGGNTSGITFESNTFNGTKV